jgi:hypothetical protein
LMIANMSAFALARHWRKVPIYEALLAQDGIFLPENHPPDPQNATEMAEHELPAATD